MNRRFFWAFLAFLSLASMAMVALSIAPLGAGVSTDAAIQMSTAENLLHGKGFIDFANRPFVSWPPLYPLLLAGASLFTSGDSLIAGGFLNVLLAGLVVWLGGALLYEVFSGDLFWASAGAVILAGSQSLIRIAANISTDPLFYVLSLAFLLAANRYLMAPNWKNMLAMAIFTALACLQRLPGVALLMTGILLVLRAHPGVHIRQLLPKLLGYSTSIAPLAIWIIGHNYLGSNSLVGNRNLSQTWPLFNLGFSIERMYDWFFPHRLLTLIPFSIIGGVSLIIFLAVYHSRARLASLWHRLLQPALFPAQLFLVVYLVIIIFSYNSNDSDYLYFDRYQLVILAPVIILVFTILQIAWNESNLTESRWLSKIPLGVFLIWLAFPVYSDYTYVAVSRAYGVLDYNIYNTQDVRQKRIISKVQQLAGEENPVVYSNYPAMAWLYTRSTVYYSPRGPNDQPLDADRLVKEYQGWPGDQPAYLVWFLPNDYHHILPPNQLSRLAQLNLVYNDPSGKIYQAVARQQ